MHGVISAKSGILVPRFWWKDAVLVHFVWSFVGLGYIKGIYINYMSCGRNYVHGELAMSKLGGPLSVMKVLKFLSFHYMKWSRFQKPFHCDGVLISYQPRVACWPCVFSSLSWFCFAGYFFQFWPLRGCFRHSWRMPACSSFVLLLYLPIQKCETGETFNNSLVNFLGPKSQDEIESSLSKCGACPSASMKPYMKGIGRYRLGYRLRTPAFSPESVSGHSLQ